MMFDRRTHAMILLSLILIVGIIHLGVGIGIVARYHNYHDVFQQTVSLSGYNIFVGLSTIIVGIFALVSVYNCYSLMSTISSILTFIVGIIALASLITALALSANSTQYMRDTITNNMNNYVESSDAISIIDDLQTKYQCCGVNLWLDWARVSLGVPAGLVTGRRRRRYSSLPLSPLTKALRQKRQIITSGTGVYNLPSTYSINLPLSCCRSGGTTIGNSLGGYCVFNANNGTSSFYVSGCLVAVAGIASSQITGIAVINTCLTILAFVCFTKLINLFPQNDDSSEKQPRENQMSQGYEQQQQQWQQQPHQQQYSYETHAQYPINNNNPRPYSGFTIPTYRTYL